jgi:hypothetical protein
MDSNLFVIIIGIYSDDNNNNNNTAKLLYSLRFSYYLITLKVPIMNYFVSIMLLYCVDNVTITLLYCVDNVTKKTSETSRLESPWG